MNKELIKSKQKEKTYQENLSEYEAEKVKLKEDNLKREIEKDNTKSSISIQTKENDKMTEIIFNDIPKEYSSLEYIFKKEKEIKEKITLNSKAGADINNSEQIIKEANNIITGLKMLSGITVTKTKEGLLRIDFLDANKLKVSECSIVIEIVGNTFRIADIHPKINYKVYEDELNKYRNFTYFLSHIIIGDFIKYLK